MNKPKRKAFVKKYGWEHTERYIQALETYTHYLEKALDKACELIVNAYWGKETKKWTKEQWKEWLMKDE